MYKYKCYIFIHYSRFLLFGKRGIENFQKLRKFAKIISYLQIDNYQEHDSQKEQLSISFNRFVNVSIFVLSIGSFVSLSYRKIFTIIL